MNTQYMDPFVIALETVLTKYGVADIQTGQLQKKENMYIESDVTAIIGLVGNIRGNVAFSLSVDTSKKILTVMMDGEPVPEMGDMARSTIGELANMITGTALTLLSKTGTTTDITPPSVIFGKDVFFILSSVPAIEAIIKTQLGDVTVNIAFEM
jgi:chemotaxis protein CheX